MSVSRLAGVVAGAVAAPLFALGSLVRRARVFHPVGSCWTARAVPAEGVPAELAEVAAALAGPARVRLSGAVWKRHDARRDILGVAVRFGESWRRHEPDDLDLLFATFRTVAGLLPALVTTDGRDFFANTYWTVVPFRIGPARGTFRCVPARASPGGRDRLDALRRAVDGTPTFRIEALVDGRAAPLVDLVLEEERSDQASLRFAPWRGGRGVAPVGFLTGVRRLAYPSSQCGRRLLGR